MDWMKIIGSSLQYIEEHITEDLDVEKIAGEVNVSPFYFQKGFSMLCGFTVGEYVRNRRLALAGSELVSSSAKVIDIALKYGYDSPDSFTKAFVRFHGVTPVSVRKDGVTVKTFAPLKIKFTLEGGYLMDYKIVKKEAFKVIGNSQRFSYENAKELIPAFWQKHYKEGKGAVVCGTFGVNIDEQMGGKDFEYLIADLYEEGRTVPDGFVLRTIPAFNWAVFACKGALPDSLRNVNRRIFSEWLPALGEYEFAAGYCIEYYDDPAKYKKGTSDENYYCEIWIPVNKKL